MMITPPRTKLCVVARALLLMVFATQSRAATDPVDVVVYGDHVPAKTLGGAPFTNPFAQQEFSGDPVTRLVVRAARGISRPLGTVGWGGIAWGKYFLFGAYDERGSGMFQNIADQRIGVFDTETHQFCQLDVDPGHAANAGIEHFGITNPDARQTRIFFEGFAYSPGVPLGYIEADADNPSPCDPVTGWQVVGISASQLDTAASAGGLPLQKSPCEGSYECGLDGIAGVDHDPLTGKDTVVINNWFASKIAVVQVDATGSVTVPDVDVVPVWKPVNNGGACYTLRPVSQPMIDHTRTSGDKRIVYTFDPTCDAPSSTPGCTWAGVCPPAGASCSVGGTCPGSYCQTPFFGGYVTCTSRANCQNVFGIDLGECTNGCLSVNPHQTCSTNPSQNCAQSANCPGTNPTCDCNIPGRPSQELRFDGTSLTPTSGLFQTAQNHDTNALMVFTNDGDAWIRDDIRPDELPTAAKGPVVYVKEANGEHRYYDPAAATSSVIVPEDTDVGFSHDTSSWWAHVFDTASRAERLRDGDTVFLLGRQSLQRSNKASGTWLRDTGFKLALGTGILPNEPKRCSGGSRGGNGCTVTADCPGGTCVVQEFAVGQSFPLSLALGGSPPSLWTSPCLLDIAGKLGAMDSWVIRLPVATKLPDSQSGTRPGAAWANGRLWLVSEHGGALSYRTRDQGFWSSWFPLPANVAIAGGATVAANAAGTAVRLFARGAREGNIYVSSLTSPTGCVAGGCTWSSWTMVPNSPVTDIEPAATFRGPDNPLVAVRRTSDNKIVRLRLASMT